MRARAPPLYRAVHARRAVCARFGGGCRVAGKKRRHFFTTPKNRPRLLLIIQLKTPLAAAILDAVHPPPLHALTLPGLLADCAAAGCPIGLVVNLTSGPPLYAADLTAAGVGPDPSTPVRYAHVPLIAKAFPSRDELAAVRAALAAAAPLPAARRFVALHCSYGFNRTGFVIVSLLVEAHGLPVRDALAAFAAARPPGIRHARFVTELLRRYDQDTLPPLPSSPGSGAVSPRAGGGGSSGATTPRRYIARRSGGVSASGRTMFRNASGVSLDNESLAGGDASGRWAAASAAEADGDARRWPPARRRDGKQAACVVM